MTHYKTVFSHGHHIFVYKTVNYKSCIYIKGHLLDRATFLPALIKTNEACQSSVRCYIFLDQISLMVMNLLVNKFCFSRVHAVREHGVVHGAESCLALSCVHRITSPAFWSSRVHFWVPESQQFSKLSHRCTALILVPWQINEGIEWGALFLSYFCLLQQGLRVWSHN